MDILLNRTFLEPVLPLFLLFAGWNGFLTHLSDLLVAQEVFMKSSKRTFYFFFLPFATFLRGSSSVVSPALTVLVREDSA